MSGRKSDIGFNDDKDDGHNVFCDYHSASMDAFKRYAMHQMKPKMSVAARSTCWEALEYMYCRQYTGLKHKSAATCHVLEVSAWPLPDHRTVPTLTTATTTTAS